MASKPSLNLNAADGWRQISRQFQGLDMRDASLWPVIPKVGLLLLVVAIVVGLAWFAKLSDEKATLESEQANELTLRTQYQEKVAKAVALDGLKKQREQVMQYVNVLEKQLPSKAEMDALLSDVNQAGLGRSLQFELFRPGQVVLRDYYAELPIALKVTGQYHDIGAFAADIANLSRIVTLNNIAIAPPADKEKSESGVLTLEAMAKTFRYLDADEIAVQQAAAAKARSNK